MRGWGIFQISERLENSRDVTNASFTEETEGSEGLGQGWKEDGMPPAVESGGEAYCNHIAGAEKA